MPWYRSREFRAVQWTGDNLPEIADLIRQKPIEVRQGKLTELRFLNSAIGGTTGVMPGDYVVEHTWPDGSHYYGSAKQHAFEESNSLCRPNQRAGHI